VDLAGNPATRAERVEVARGGEGDGRAR
jgi:hypothetical protein